jgi:hypothetical protein
VISDTDLKMLARDARDSVRLVWGAGEHGYDRLATALFRELVKSRKQSEAGHVGDD